MSIQAGLRALTAATALAYGVGHASAVYAAEEMVVMTLIEGTDFLSVVLSDFGDLLTAPMVEFNNLNDIIAVPGPVMGAGLPVLLALGAYAWVRFRRVYEHNIVAQGPDETGGPIDLPNMPNQPLQAIDRVSFALLGLGLIATPAWMGFLAYVPGRLIGWW